LASWLWPAFKIGELALAGFQNRRVGSGRHSKALGAALRNLLSNRSKGFKLAGFKKHFVPIQGNKIIPLDKNRKRHNDTKKAAGGCKTPFGQL
jgi:hypothetical protein